MSRIYHDALEELRPPPKLSPSEWSEKHVVIPVGNAIPGPIRFSNAPYQVEPLNMVANPECRRISLMWGAQVGKTQIMNCALGYFIAHAPQSQIVMQPTEEDLFTWLDTKFQTMLDATPVLSERMAKPRGREGVNNKRLKTYPGGALMFAFAGAPRTMRSRSAPRIYCDEVDGYPVTPEGHPVSLLWQRAATFGDERQLLVSSTPTIKGASTIEAAYSAGDRRKYWVPCPHCGEFITFEWENVSFAVDSEELPIPESAGYACQECGALIDDGQKVAAVRAGEWRAEREFRGHASYHISELYSAFRSWADIVESFREKKAEGDVQTFWNVSLARTWEESGEEASPHILMERVEQYDAEVPAGGVVLTAGIDMQVDRLEVEVVAWGLGEESWSIDHRVLWGDPLHPDVWEDLDELLATTYVHASGAVLGIRAAALDTGGTDGYPQAAYEYARKRRGRRLFAVKGVGGWGRPVVSAPSKKKTAARARRVQLFPVGVDEAKLIVMRRLNLAAPGPGYCHFPDDRTPEWFEQLTAERLVTRYVHGYAHRSWHMTRERNEALDCRVYALAALKIVAPNIKRLADQLAEEEHPAEHDDGSATEPAGPVSPDVPEDDDGPKRQRRVWRKKPRRRR